MINMHNRKQILEKLPEPGLMGGIVPVAPVNQLSMLRDYIEPAERLVACPNQDVVYGLPDTHETSAEMQMGSTAKNTRSIQQRALCSVIGSSSLPTTAIH